MESKVIQQYVQGEALQKFPIVPDPNMPEIITDRYEPLRIAHASGLTAGIELMGEFTEWINDNSLRKHYDGTDGKWKWFYDQKYYTTTQLIELFLTNKMNEK